MSNKGINLELDTIENNTTGVIPVIPTFPSGLQFIGVFGSLDELKSYSSKNSLGDLAIITREIKHEGLPSTVEFDEYVYTGSTYGWAKSSFKSKKSLEVSIVNDTVGDINRVQEFYNTNPSEWGYDNIFPTNTTLDNLKSKFGICISNGICDEFLSIGKTLDFIRAIKLHKERKTLSASTLVEEMRELASFTDKHYRKDAIPVNVQNNVNCHIWLLCVSALTAHMWWDDQVVKILKEYEDRMIDEVVLSPNDNIITCKFVDRTIETIGRLIKLDPKCIGTHLNEVQLTNQSGWHLWWKQELVSHAIMQGKNLRVYRFKKYLGRYIRSAFRGLWTLIHN